MIINITKIYLTDCIELIFIFVSWQLKRLNVFWCTGQFFTFGKEWFRKQVFWLNNFMKCTHSKCLPLLLSRMPWVNFLCFMCGSNISKSTMKTSEKITVWTSRTSTTSENVDQENDSGKIAEILSRGCWSHLTYVKRSVSDGLDVKCPNTKVKPLFVELNENDT